MKTAETTTISHHLPADQHPSATRIYPFLSLFQVLLSFSPLSCAFLPYLPSPYSLITYPPLSRSRNTFDRLVSSFFSFCLFVNLLPLSHPLTVTRCESNFCLPPFFSPHSSILPPFPPSMSFSPRAFLFLPPHTFFPASLVGLT